MQGGAGAVRDAIVYEEWDGDLGWAAERVPDPSHADGEQTATCVTLVDVFLGLSRTCLSLGAPTRDAWLDPQHPHVLRRFSCHHLVEMFAAPVLWWGKRAT